MVTVYHNPRCRKSRAGLQYVIDKKLEYSVRDYMKVPFSEEELGRLLMKLNAKPKEMIRTQEELFRKELKGLNLNDKEWIRIMAENPKLIKRPIVEGRYKAVLGDPVENIDAL